MKLHLCFAGIALLVVVAPATAAVVGLIAFPLLEPTWVDGQIAGRETRNPAQGPRRSTC